MAISHVASSSSQSASAAIPTGTTVDDVMIGIAYRSASATPPSLPSGWTAIASGDNGGKCAIRLAYRVFQSGDSAPTWTNATHVGIISLRGAKTSEPVGAVSSVTTGNSSTVTVPSLTLNETAGDSWVVAGYGHERTNGLGTPASMTERLDVGTNNAPSVAGSDTNAGVASWSGSSAAASQSREWIAVSLEVLVAAGGISGAGNIASGEAFGSAALSVNVAATGAASGETFGTSSVQPVLSPGAIGSGEAFGSPTLTQTLSAVGIASAETFGASAVSVNVSPVAVASAEAFGLPDVGTSGTITGAGNIASAEAFGVATLSVTVAASSVASGESIGTPVLAVSVLPVGVASGESLGLASLIAAVSPVGMASDAAIGGPTISPSVAAAGVSSGEQFGTAVLSLEIAAVGVTSVADFGQPIVGDPPEPGQSGCYQTVLRRLRHR